MSRPTDDGRRVPGAVACLALAAILASYVMLPRMNAWAAVPVVGSALVIVGGVGGTCWSSDTRSVCSTGRFHAST